MGPLLAAAARTWSLDEHDLARQMPATPLAPTLAPGEIARFILDYYRPRALPPGYGFYERHGITPAVIWKKPSALVRSEQVVIGPSRPVAPPPIEAALPCLQRLIEGGAQLWNDEILRLHGLEFHGPQAHAEFSPGRFFDYRFTTGLLGEEAASGAHALRDHLMPTMAGFADRFTAGGMQALVAVARPAPHHDFAIPLQVRSRRVSDGQGLYGVIPMAYHQAIRRHDRTDARGLSTALREFAEELCGLAEDQEFETVPAIAELQRNAILEITGFSLNLVNGNYDYNILICHPDPAYWENYASQWSPNWEAERTLIVSSRDHGTFHRLASHQHWVPQSLVSLWEGLDRLRAIDPSRC